MIPVYNAVGAPTKVAQAVPPARPAAPAHAEKIKLLKGGVGTVPSTSNCESRQGRAGERPADPRRDDQRPRSAGPGPR